MLLLLDEAEEWIAPVGRDEDAGVAAEDEGGPFTEICKKKRQGQ